MLYHAWVFLPESSTPEVSKCILKPYFSLRNIAASWEMPLLYFPKGSMSCSMVISFTFIRLNVYQPLQTRNGNYSSLKPGMGSIQYLSVLLKTGSMICFTTFQSWSMIKSLERTLIIIFSFAYSSKATIISSSMTIDFYFIFSGTNSSSCSSNVLDWRRFLTPLLLCPLK